MGMLTAMTPARVSRTPHRLIFRALGETCKDMMTRIKAAAMTKMPGKRSKDRPSFLLRVTFRFQSIGIGVMRIRASVAMLRVEAT
jgi:hypothetical protein